jgi:hypothetical protein
LQFSVPCYFAWHVGNALFGPHFSRHQRPHHPCGPDGWRLAVLCGCLVRRLTRPTPGISQDDWWRANLTRAIGIWTLVEAPTLLGTVAYLTTHDFRTLIATLTGLLLFVNYRPSRLAEA